VKHDDGYTLAEPELLLSDSSVLFVLLDCGADCAARILDHFGDRLHVVYDVWREAENHKDDAQPPRRSEGFAEFFARFPDERARQLPPAIQSKVRARLRLAAKWEPKKHADADLGETSTCYYADHVRDEEEFLVLIGDQWGWSLSYEFDLAYRKTNEVVIYLVCNDVITLDEAEAMWLKLSAGSVDGLHAHIGKERPDLLPASDESESEGSTTQS
jgi:hypothetical protein